MLGALDAGQLVQVVWVSLVAGLGATTIFSLIVFSTGRCAAARRAGEGAAAVGYGALAATCGLVFAAGVALAIDVMLSKS
jgi:hypothetical protein